MKDDLHFLRLWDLYSPLLTPTQREITDLYFNYDLSFGEIAEQKGVSRQSVSDCLQKCRKQLEGSEEKLGFDRALTQADEEYSAYMTTVNRWISSMRESRPEISSELQELEGALHGVIEEYGGEIVSSDGENTIVGRTFRENEEK